MQLDIYGELMDTVYLSPTSTRSPSAYDFWRHVRKMVDWICKALEGPRTRACGRPRAGKQRLRVQQGHELGGRWTEGVRLAEKRSLSRVELGKWRQVRDEIYEEVQDEGLE